VKIIVDNSSITHQPLINHSSTTHQPLINHSLTTHYTLIAIACFGPYTTAYVRKRGLNVSVTARDFSSFSGFLEAIEEYLLFIRKKGLSLVTSDKEFQKITDLDLILINLESFT